MISQAVVPAAGLGTRLLPATKAIPKGMLPLGIKPVLEHVLEELAAAGVRQATLVVGAGGDIVERHFEPDPDLAEQLRGSGRQGLLARIDSERHGVSLRYVRQPQLLGLADAVRCARPALGPGPFLLALGDSIIRGEGTRPLCARLADALVEREASCAVAVETVPRERVGDYGVAVPREPGPVPQVGSFEIGGIVEKPEPGDAPGTLAVAGRYALGPGVFDELDRLEPSPGELELTSAIAALIDAGERVLAVPLAPGERRVDTGTPAGYARAFIELALADPEIGPELRDEADE